MLLCILTKHSLTTLALSLSFALLSYSWANETFASPAELLLPGVDTCCACKWARIRSWKSKCCLVGSEISAVVAATTGRQENTLSSYVFYGRTARSLSIVQVWCVCCHSTDAKLAATLAERRRSFDSPIDIQLLLEGEFVFACNPTSTGQPFAW